MKVRESIKDPDSSTLNKTAVEVGELLESKGWELRGAVCLQSTQTFYFEREGITIDISIEENEEDNEHDNH